MILKDIDEACGCGSLLQTPKLTPQPHRPKADKIPIHKVIRVKCAESG